MRQHTWRPCGHETLDFRWDRDSVEQFLAFGFVPEMHVEDPLCLLAGWSRRPRRRLEAVEASQLVHEGAAALRAAMEQSLAADDDGRQHVVFLSGGLDSRVILASLLEIVDTSRIVAATFGLPGEQDFDFAAAVAREAGVRHEVLESRSVDWTTERLVESVLARQLPLPAVFGQRYLSYVLHQRLGTDHVYWDGLCGDGVGGKLSPREGEDWTWGSAVDGFLAFHLKPWVSALVSRSFNARARMPSMPFCDKRLLAYPDQLVFGIRQRCNTATRLLRDYDVRTPFLAQPWLDFMLTVPVRFRQDQRLYRDIQRQAFPRLFSLPTTALAGGAVTEPRLLTTAREFRLRARRKATTLGILRHRTASPAGANPGIRASYQREGTVRDLVLENLADLRGRPVLDGLPVPALLGAAETHVLQNPALVTRLVDLELNLKAADRLQDLDMP